MSPRVAYWCSSFEPEMEAIAKEVAVLRQAFPGSGLWGISQKHLLRFSRSRGFACHPKLHLIFDGVTRLLQARYDLNHIYGGLGEWLHLRAIRDLPTLLTVAVITGPAANTDLYKRVDRFVVEWPGAKEVLDGLGVSESRVRVIRPPVDLDQFCVVPPPAMDPFRVVFASSPDQPDWLEGRGVDLVLDAAMRRPQMQFVLQWRPWGNSLPVVQRWIEDRGLSNVSVETDRVDNMAAVYQKAHATVFCVVDPRMCKPVPNSIAESMACGRPVVVTNRTGLAELVIEHRAGFVIEPDAEALAVSLDELADNLQSYGTRARSAAESAFDQSEFVRAYRQIYNEMV